MLVSEMCLSEKTSRKCDFNISKPRIWNQVELTPNDRESWTIETFLKKKKLWNLASTWE